jgi:hypothetical protein
MLREFMCHKSVQGITLDNLRPHVLNILRSNCGSSSNKHLPNKERTFRDVLLFVPHTEYNFGQDDFADESSYISFNILIIIFQLTQFWYKHHACACITCFGLLWPSSGTQNFYNHPSICYTSLHWPLFTHWECVIQVYCFCNALML